MFHVHLRRMYSLPWLGSWSSFYRINLISVVEHLVICLRAICFAICGYFSYFVGALHELLIFLLVCVLLNLFMMFIELCRHFILLKKTFHKISFCKKILFIYIYVYTHTYFLEREEKRRGRKTSMSINHCLLQPPTGDRAHTLGM